MFFYVSKIAFLFSSPTHSNAFFSDNSPIYAAYVGHKQYGDNNENVPLVMAVAYFLILVLPKASPTRVKRE